MIFVLAGLCLGLSMLSAALGDTWGWFLWWVLALILGVVGVIKGAG